ncbi:MAG: phosphoenolpyruvate--protein phosphotransferase [Gammaproteobacteria bacterium]|nr:phosphoenolpyruvate--protein phosphotransferase [Gammaproteobacteria bacterium]
MLTLHGSGVSQGISIGRAYVLRREQLEIPEYVIPRQYIDDELERFKTAIAAARQQLQHVRDHMPAGAPPETASLIDAHLLILGDAMISQAPIDIINEQQRNSEWVLKTQSEDLGRIFEAMHDPYLRAKKIDVDQVVDRILRNLLTTNEQDDEAMSNGQILVARDLTPADTVMLKQKRIRAFVTDLGGPISHTAILARSLGIPAIVSLHNATRFIRTGDKLVVDGKCGLLIAGEYKRIFSEYRRRQQQSLQTRRELDRIRAGRSITDDGQKIRLLANVELPADLKTAVKVHASGIGLYRTEFLFMNRPTAPTEEEQYRACLKVVKAFAGKPVTIRTLDLAADKQAANPALGLRAVRLCLHDISLFRPQLRAILRASAYGKVRMMIPMLSSLDELFHVLDLIKETESELKKQRKEFNHRMPIGGMIEVPAAAISADLFAPHLDFLSIGTNDLIQYTLAIDRSDDTVNYLYDPLHPSVLRLINNVIKAGKAAGIPVAMCGEMAGDARYTRLLLGMGLKEFSMHPSMLLEIKEIVRMSSFANLRSFAHKVLRSRDVDGLRTLIDKMNAESNVT